MKKELLFTVREDGTLLACVRERLRDLPPGKVKSYLEHRMISVDGLVTSQFDYPVRQGQTIKLRFSGGSTAGSPLKLVYEDEYLFAVNKPAGLLTVATDTEKERTAFRLLRDSGVEPIFTVHRLDKDTSGVLLFAKSEAVRDTLQENWDSVITREYLAICEGVFSEKSGRCDSFLRETRTHLVYSAPTEPGKRAITNYTVLRQNADYALLRVTLETGRKNQIRVHMKELSHPVVGDKKYGAKTNPLKRLGLHASALAFIHPVSGTPVRIEAPTEPGFHLPKRVK